MHFSYIYLIPVVTTLGVVLAYIVSKASRPERRTAQQTRPEAPQPAAASQAEGMQIAAQTQVYAGPNPTTTAKRLQRLSPLTTGPLASANGHTPAGQAPHHSAAPGKQS